MPDKTFSRREKKQGSDPERQGVDASGPKKARSRSEIEARRDRAMLKASLADVWDEDFDLDEDVLADLDHNAEYFTRQADPEDIDLPDEESEDVFEDDEDL